ncbi:MAG: hypothetical protein J0I13_13310, partial [Rhizobiales bacterium]|nr:hypothetical protein [Hyphomicrobiales bacterium]
LFRTFKPRGSPCYGEPFMQRGYAMSAETKLFLCLQDNYGVLVHDPARAAQAARQRAAGQWTIPTTIAEEKAANPFLRADVPAVAAAVGLAGKPAAEVFAEVRARKNKS